MKMNGLLEDSMPKYGVPGFVIPLDGDLEQYAQDFPEPEKTTYGSCEKTVIRERH